MEQHYVSLADKEQVKKQRVNMKIVSKMVMWLKLTNLHMLKNRKYIHRGVMMYIIML